MQITIEMPDAIAQRLQLHWSNLRRKILELLFQAAQQAELVSSAEADAALEQTVTDAPASEVLDYMERQATLYSAQRDALTQRYLGQYVLFADGQVLDADRNFETLILRAYAETGPRDVFIQQVGSEDVTPMVRTPLLSRAF